jgi:eukaryotic-like serine/threonine-protein kinase
MEATIADAVEPAPRRREERYMRIGSLGAGAVGEVVLVEDREIGRRVALKRMKPREGQPTTPRWWRFDEEVRVVGQLEHPNIVPIHDVGTDDDGRRYFTMKFVEGETLYSVLERLRAGDADAHARFTFPRRTRIFAEILRAIHHAHERGILHRDIKPANVMIGPADEVTVMDWGLARRLEMPVRRDRAPVAVSDRPGDTQVGAVIGTPAYMSPEQARGRRLDERSDIYSLGVLFHEFVTLQHYLGSRRGNVETTLASVEHVDAPFAASVVHPHQARVPMELARFLEPALAKRPRDRYASVSQMQERLERMADGLIDVECPMTLTKRSAYSILHLMDNHPTAGIAALATSTIAGAASLGWTVYSLVSWLAGQPG